jgi:hypothetical protein
MTSKSLSSTHYRPELKIKIGGRNTTNTEKIISKIESASMSIKINGKKLPLKLN